MPEKRRLTCVCGASAADSSRERGRFLRRHPPDVDKERHLAELRELKLRRQRARDEAAR